MNPQWYTWATLAVSLLESVIHAVEGVVDPQTHAALCAAHAALVHSTPTADKEV